MALAIQLAVRDMKTVMFLDSLLDAWQDCDIQDNPFLQGNFAPVTTEHRAVPLQVIQGELPASLSGLFVRNGPNPIPSHVTKCHHWFDGHGMMHNVRIRNGTATYTNSYVPTPRYKFEKKLSQEFFIKLGELVGIPGLLKILLLSDAKQTLTKTTKLTSGQANTHSIMYQDKFYALHEASLPFEVRLTDHGGVEEVGYETCGNVLDYPVSAHPKVDFESGNLLFHGYAADPELSRRDGGVKVGELAGTSGQVEFYYGVDTEDKRVSFAHDMAFTKHWILLFDSSVVFDGAQIILKKSVFHWNNERNLKIGLIPRTPEYRKAWATDVLWIDVGAPHATVHPLNAWEEDDGTIVIWLPLGDQLSMELNAEERNSFYMAEIRLNPRTGTVKKTKIDEEYNVEFSRVRDDCSGKFAQFGFTAFADANNKVEGYFNGFNVWDMEHRRVHRAVRFPKDETGGEPVIIPKPATLGSNEVYIGVFLYNNSNESSSFALYDGENASDMPVVKLRMPYSVPYGFHGRWVDEAELQSHMEYHKTKAK